MTQWQYQYRIDSIQLRFLKLLNNKAYQALSLSCCGFEDMENESLSTANTNTVIQCWNGSKIRYPRVNCATHQDTSPSGNDPEVTHDSSLCVCCPCAFTINSDSFH
jgi:hypothetical protein